MKIITKQTSNSTVGQLMSLHNQIQAMNGTATAFLLRSRIKDFYDKNGIRIETNGKKINAILEKYFEMDENKKIKVDETKNRVFKAGMKEDDYKAEWAEIMNALTIIL